MSYDMMCVLKPDGANPGAGGSLKNVIYAVLLDDITTFPARDADLVTQTTPLVIAAGKYVHELYATDKTIEISEKKLSGDNKDAGGVEISVKFFHPGLEAKIQEFKAKHMNSDLIIFVRNCAADRTYMIGESCNPVSLEDWEAQWGKSVEEGKGTTFTLMSKQSLPMAIYAADITTLLQTSGSLV